MGNAMKTETSRRTFIKGMAAAGAVAVFTGCGSGGSDDTIVAGNTLKDPIPEPDLSGEKIFWSAGSHNCGAGTRCASRIHVVNEKIVRVSSDDDDYDYEGVYRDKEQWNDSRSLACAKCRSYKYRAYHNGRLKYPLKQTGTRGDMSGFIRIRSEDALEEVVKIYRNIVGKYTGAAVYNTYATATGYAGKYANCSNARTIITNLDSTRGTYSDYSFHQYSYSHPMTGHPGILQYSDGIGNGISAIANTAKNIVSWGSNVMTTNNTMAYPYIRAAQELKTRGGKIYHISPEFVDTGVVNATDWVQVRNYTDAALIMGMFHEMIVNTFNSDGEIINDAELGIPLLDVNYIDTFVYGFFDSPEYWVNTTGSGGGIAGEISFTDHSTDTVNWRKVDAVPEGKSLSAYVMGSDDRLTRALYAGNVNDVVAVANYTAEQFKSSSITKRNQLKCSLQVTLSGVPKPAYDWTEAEIAAGSKYRYKRELMTPKTPEWAEKICGTPASTIRKLARLYCNPANHPIVSEWCGGIQKQDNGVVSLFAIAALMCVTKTFGLAGEHLYGGWASNIPAPGTPIGGNLPLITAPASVAPLGINTTISPTGSPNHGDIPVISVKEWYNAIKIGFMEKLIDNGYTGAHLPNWDGTSRYYGDDGGTKAQVLWKRDASGVVQTYLDTNDNKTYQDFVGRDAEGPGVHKPVFVGTRMIINPGGGIPVNQHFNSNDSAEMYRCLPPASISDPDCFCLVTFDIFLSPSARFSDYVFPAVTPLETADETSIGDQVVLRPAVIQPPGEAKSGWRYAFEAAKIQANLATFTTTYTNAGGEVYTKTPDPDAHWKYVGTNGATVKTYVDPDIYINQEIDAAIANPVSRFYGMTREQVYEKQYLPRKNMSLPPSPATDTLRLNLDAYLALNDTTRKGSPFCFSGANTSVEAYVNTYYMYNGSPNHLAFQNYVAEPIANRPNPSGRFHVYNDMAVWDYRWKFSKFHGWLSEGERGQKNADREGDPVVLPIPIYWNFEDSFDEAYGKFDGKNLDYQGEFTLGTTHDRFRVHSSEAENPLLRELNHRTVGGKWASGNDWNEFVVVPEVHPLEGSANIAPMLSEAIYKKNRATASWHEVWMNREDAESKGISDGDLIQVENPIGAVRVIARLTDRCIRGHMNLHQGSWYDPNPIDGVDDGGCANTLMSSLPTRYDGGNSQQFAYVRVKKITNFFG
ncbi:MAG: molybdopterin-dependent oxidoreductase [Deferribacteraceae bacterium]|jgi:anaerobic selenocysteine-containing dehydrogenase|nr:molybdopterin-dependent oxidoreductase [Deferribacteraceae bacterium]